MRKGKFPSLPTRVLNVPNLFMVYLKVFTSHNLHCTHSFSSAPVPEFIDPRFRENKPKTLVFSHWKRAFWACFRENRVYNFGHW